MITFITFITKNNHLVIFLVDIADLADVFFVLKYILIMYLAMHNEILEIQIASCVLLVSAEIMICILTVVDATESSSENTAVRTGKSVAPNNLLLNIFHLTL